MRELGGREGRGRRGVLLGGVASALSWYAAACEYFQSNVKGRARPPNPAGARVARRLRRDWGTGSEAIG